GLCCLVPSPPPDTASPPPVPGPRSPPPVPPGRGVSVGVAVGVGVLAGSPSIWMSGVVSVPYEPSLPVTAIVARQVPGPYVCDGLRSVLSAPSPKYQWYVHVTPPGSLTTSTENWTGLPRAGVAVSTRASTIRVNPVVWTSTSSGSSVVAFPEVVIQ